MNKKAVAVAVAAMAFPMAAYSADIYESGIYKPEANVYVSGKLKDGYQSDCVSICIKNGSDIKYITEALPDENGRYEVKFKYRDDIMPEDRLYVGDTNADLTDSVINAVTDSIIEIEELNIKNKYGMDFVGKDDIAAALVKAVNKYRDSQELTFYIAGYNSDGKLINVYKRDMDIGYDAVAKIDLLSDFCITEDMTRVKLFSWERNSLKSFCENAEKRINTPFETNKETTVAFLGDSLTYLGNYTKYLETYYETKYPGNKITFVNKGIGGDTAAGINKRLYYDILKSEFTKRPDQVSILIGMNDVGYTAYPAGADIGWVKLGPDDCINSTKKIAETLKSENIEVDLISPALFDEADQMDKENHKGANLALSKVADGFRSYAEENDMDFIDLYKYSNEINDLIRRKNPEQGEVLSSDRIHPSSVGGYLYACLIAQCQGSGTDTASVEIDVNGNDKIYNADVCINTKTTDYIEYTYTPKALPMPVTNDFIKLRDFGFDIQNIAGTEKISVNGLDDGDYTISFDDKVLEQTYTAKQLERGINIAYDANNPSQSYAQEIYTKSVEKYNAECKIMDLTRWRVSLINNNISLDDNAAVKEHLGETNYQKYVDYLSNYESNKANLEEIERVRKQTAEQGISKAYTVKISKSA